MTQTSLRAGLAFASAALLALPAIGAARDPVIVYSPMAGATALHDELGQTTLRQAPVQPDRRWSTGRRVAKVNGKQLSRLSASRIAMRLRAAWRDPNTGSRVAIDEISPNHWSGAAATRLRAAMALLGADQKRVTFYAAPSMVEQLGRVDPRKRLSAKHSRLIDAMSRGRATYLLAYRGNLQPYPPREMASHPTRWVARWPAGRGTLHLMLGPDGGIGQRALWERARSSPAGRRLLANGPAAYGLRTARAGRAWAAEYARFLSAPTAPPPAGDFPVPVPGGLGVKRAGPRAVVVTSARPGRVVVSVAKLPGGTRRAIRKLNGVQETLVRFPADLRPGRYRVTAVLQGDGLTDRASVNIAVRRPKVKLAYRNRLFTLTVPKGARAVLSLNRNGKRRTIGKATGPATKRIRLKKNFPKGAYTAVVGTSGAGGQKIRRTVRVR